MFSLVNLARFLNLDAELTLRLANKRFQERFEFVEAELVKQAKMWSECSLEELDDLGEEAKRKNKKSVERRNREKHSEMGICKPKKPRKSLV